MTESVKGMSPTVSSYSAVRPAAACGRNRSGSDPIRRAISSGFGGEALARRAITTRVPRKEAANADAGGARADPAPSLVAPPAAVVRSPEHVRDAAEEHRLDPGSGAGVQARHAGLRGGPGGDARL